jgi:autoinducer 2-binding protein LuxP
MKRNKLAFLIVFLMLGAFSYAFANEETEYFTIDQFYSDNPHQAELSESFASNVTSQPERIKMRQPHSIKIAVIYPAIQQSNYWRDSVRSMDMRLDELGIRHETVKYFSRPSGDYRLQTMQISEASKSDADYIVLSVDNPNVRRLVPSLVSKSKAKIMIQNLTTPLKEWKQHQPFMYVGFDHVEGSKMLADKYSEIFPSGGKYVLLYGAKGAVSEQRGGGFESYALSKGFVAVAKYYTDFKADNAYEAAKSALEKNEDVAFIYSCSTDISIGASKAVNEAGLTGTVFVNGWGGTINELNLLKEKLLDFTVMRMNDDNGVAIAEAVKMDMSGQSKNIPLIFSGEFVIATKDMSQKELDKLTERALRYSGK